MRRRLSSLKLRAVMIDGVHFADHLVLVAVCIDLGGKKHVPGLREGATESAAYKALLADLSERRLSAECALPFVIDGAKTAQSSTNAMLGASSASFFPSCSRIDQPTTRHEKKFRITRYSHLRAGSNPAPAFKL